MSKIGSPIPHGPDYSLPRPGKTAIRAKILISLRDFLPPSELYWCLGECRASGALRGHSDSWEQALTDAELLRGVQAGDLSAWERLYDRYLPTLWRYVYLHADGDRHLAEDVVGETILALVRQVSELNPGDGNLAGWLIAVARNKLGDHRRSVARRALATKAVGEGTSPAAAPEDSLEAAERREQILAALDRLPGEERLVLEWKYIEELSVGEIAGRLGRTEKAVESVLYRARRSFRTIMGSRLGDAP